MSKLTLFTLTIIMLIGGSVVAKDWTESFKIEGDFRYRHEMIDKEDSDTRNRQRIRARIDLIGKVNEETHVVVGISSGSSDPVSNNQSLSGSFTSKNLLIDKAYVEYEPAKAPGLKLTGGKMYNPFYKPAKSELVWDSDIRQEGMRAEYSTEMDNVKLQFIGSGLWIEERSSDDDSYLMGGQAVLGYNMEDSDVSLGGGASYFYYGNTKGFATFYEDDDSYGNTIDGDDAYATDFEMLELFGTVSFKANEVPVTFLGDFVTNTGADSLDTGWLIGVSVGKTKKPGSWDFRYNYREVEKDAVVGIFTDSDFRGGGTDAKGHEFGFSYQLLEKTTFAASYFINEIGLEEEETTDFNRLQLDLKFKF